MAPLEFIDVLVDETAACAGCAMRWKAESRPRAVVRVRFCPEQGGEFLCTVVGWSSTGGGTACTASAVTVEDSGGGTAVLVWGGDWGLRLHPDAGGPVLAEPYLLLAPEDIEPEGATRSAPPPRGADMPSNEEERAGTPRPEGNARPRSI